MPKRKIETRMKALLKFLYLILFLVILILLAGIILPDSQRMKIQDKVHAPAGLVFEQINIPANWKNWSPWLTGDSILTVRTFGTTAGEGAGMDWENKSFGKASMTITKSLPDEKVSGYLDLGDYGKADFDFLLEEREDHTLLKWNLRIHEIAYFERYFMFLFHKQLKKNMLSALTKVKLIGEELRLSRINKPKMVETNEMPLMLIVDTVRAADFDSARIQTFSRVRSYLERRNIEPTGKPLSLLYSYDPEGEIIFAGGYTIPKRTWSWREYQCVVLPEGRAATVTHWGIYSSSKPYLALDKYLAEKNLEPDSFIWEVYTVGKSPLTDSSLWEKQIFYPVREE